MMLKMLEALLLRLAEFSLCWQCFNTHSYIIITLNVSFFLFLITKC